MKKNMIVPTLFAMAAWCGCSDEFDPGSLVEKTRILAVQADAPFAVPGDRVELRALAYDPAGRPLSWGWGLCEAPASSSALDCLRQGSFDALELGTDLTRYTVVIPETHASYVGVVVVACPGELEAGSTETLPIVCRDAAGRALALSEFEIGVKRIFIRSDTQNQNPQIDGLTLDGAPWTEDLVPTARCRDEACRAYARQKIVVSADGAGERGVDAQGLPIAEQAVVQYYATGGVFEHDLKLATRGDNTWHARREDAGKRIDFWFVVRDDRGGVTWTTRSLQVP